MIQRTTKILKLLPSIRLLRIFIKLGDYEAILCELGDKDLAYVAGTIFAAGSDTTSSTITIMMMAAATHIDAQAHIQEELNNIMGCTQLPTFDQEMLQVTVFVLKSLRWRPVSLGGFAHHATKDIIWKNYLISAGMTVIRNYWAITNNPEVFLKPHMFNPQCWIDNAGHVCSDLQFFTFDFGHQPYLRISECVLQRSYDMLAFSDSANICAALFEICLEKRINENVVRELYAPGK
ncbi:cytochrome P450 [Suillus hirtellus]|nr:cytochrome P450 [Suillus hirtellus]